MGADVTTVGGSVAGEVKAEFIQIEGLLVTSEAVRNMERQQGSSELRITLTGSPSSIEIVVRKGFLEVVRVGSHLGLLPSIRNGHVEDFKCLWPQAIKIASGSGWRRSEYCHQNHTKRCQGALNNHTKKATKKKNTCEATHTGQQLWV